MWNDPNIGISWNDVSPNMNPLLSEKDKYLPTFDINKDYFDIKGQWIGTV